jgi:hypothetical protein
VKVLSVRQPWAHLIISGRKSIENRTWRTAYRGKLLICSTRRIEPIAPIEARYGVRIPRDLPRAGLVGCVDLIDIVEDHDDPFFLGPPHYAWLLSDPRPLPFIAMRGAQGRLFDPPEHVLAQFPH